MLWDSFLDRYYKAILDLDGPEMIVDFPSILAMRNPSPSEENVIIHIIVDGEPEKALPNRSRRQ
jgi:hypothetical protein